MNNMKELHNPVLLNKTLELIEPKEGERYLDLTAGYGGHARAFLAKTKNIKGAALVDRDDFAISNLKDLEEAGAKLIHKNFYDATLELISDGQLFDIILMDLGVSSPQLDNADRGFSLSKSGPLDMRMDRRSTKSAYQIVNECSETELTEMFVRYGEESRAQAKKIARAIVNSRPISSTDELAELIKVNSNKKYSKIHPATRIFQSIRIAVNDELEEIEKTLKVVSRLLAKGGRLGVISFHSLEDRLVKNHFKSDAEAGLESEFSTLTKKPISGKIYDVNNPRARSAKMRVAVKK
jgi:S-adenosyl-methyltransferase MraW